MPNKNIDLPTPDFRKIAEEVMKDLPSRSLTKPTI